MIDEKYIGTLDASDKRWYQFLIRDKGSEVAALNFLLKDLDCTRIYDDGSRPMQTIGYPYRNGIAGFFYINNSLAINYPELAEEFVIKLVKRHEENISFEESTPPIYYNKKSRTSNRSNGRTAKTTDIFSGAEVTVNPDTGKRIKQRENSTIRKAKALAGKSVSFAFNNFKISGNDDK